ncbi:MAG: SDR family oxidoreductase, partial [Dehalococcoidia bacterium]
TLTRTLACEWAKHNVLVNALAPTFVETALTRTALADPEFAKTVKARIPLDRWAMPEDIVGRTMSIGHSYGAPVLRSQLLELLPHCTK